jgi:tRNA(fMet)-specific endonuclease VapC
MPAYMLDTDIASYIIKRSNDLVLKRLSRISVNDVCISAITCSELSFGVAVSPKRHVDEAALQLFLKHVQVLDYPQIAAEHYGEIRAHLKSKACPSGPMTC